MKFARRVKDLDICVREHCGSGPPSLTTRG